MSENPYRFSRSFIRRMTVVLVTAIVVLPAAGIIYGSWGSCSPRG